MTIGELNALYRNHISKRIDRLEEAAFAGYCAGLSFGLAWSGKLKDFPSFYDRQALDDMLLESSQGGSGGARSSTRPEIDMEDVRRAAIERDLIPPPLETED